MKIYYSNDKEQLVYIGPLQRLPIGTINGIKIRILQIGLSESFRNQFYYFTYKILWHY